MKTYGQYCATARALDIVGDRWVLLIVRELLSQGPSRFTDLRAGLPGIATNLLAARLKEMEDNGLIARVDAPPPVATGLYQLTARGQQLRPVIEALADWGMPTMPVQHDGDTVHGSWLGLLAQTRLRDTQPERGPLTIAIDTDQMPAHLLSRDDGWLDLRRVPVRPAFPSPGPRHGPARRRRRGRPQPPQPTLAQRDADPDLLGWPGRHGRPGRCGRAHAGAARAGEQGGDDQQASPVLGEPLHAGAGVGEDPRDHGVIAAAVGHREGHAVRGGDDAQLARARGVPLSVDDELGNRNLGLVAALGADP